MSIADVQPDSGVQLLIIIGAVFLVIGLYPDLAMLMLGLGIGAWIIYNILNIRRQF